ncbi:MAG: glycosyltransferase family 4 protein [Rhodoferax sp.]|nr:glycosyltransferase family 4 protein [Rhodoferax sp.]
MTDPAEPSTPCRLRIAVLNRNFSATGGGAERYSIALVELLANRHDIHVFAQHINHTWPGVTYHRVSQHMTRPRWLNQLWYVGATWWATRRGFDIVHSHENTWHGNIQTMHVLPVKYNLFHGRQGMAYVWRWLKVATSLRLMVYLWLERQRLSGRQPRAIVVTSESLKAQTALAYPASRQALKVVTPGVDHIVGAATAEKQLGARQRLGLPAIGQCILFIGNDYRKKGLTTLLAAMAQLPMGCFLAVVGNPKQIPSFKAQAEAAGLTNRVFFLGAQKRMDVVYSAANFLVHPTLEDTFAMVVLEAMAHGLPVIVSGPTYCGISSLLTHDVTALILDDPTKIPELANAMGRMLRDAALRDRLIESGLAFANEHSWTAVGDDYDGIYRSVLRPNT